CSPARSGKSVHEPTDISVLRRELSIALERAARPTVKQAIQVKMISNGKWQRADNELFSVPICYYV
ncbi:MAG TPA: hypothetical protein VMG63_05385, partial [Terriglobia bacterium]|nr:hypothetical protein [Terriglobia bacterium]